jgi:putative nucleotidyltransferase with HDIG domain
MIAETIAQVGQCASPPAAQFDGLQRLLVRAFGTPFTLLDATTGDALFEPAGQPAGDPGMWAALAPDVARRGRPDFLDENDPLITLAIPLTDAAGREVVAVSTFLTRPLPADEALPGDTAAEIRAEDADAWRGRQAVWPPEVLLRLAESVLMELAAQRRIRELEHETHSLSVNLSSTYEEISLLYRLTQNLRLSRSDEELGRIALEWLAEVMPAESLVLHLLPLGRGDIAVTHETRTKPVFLTHGPCPIGQPEFDAIVAHLHNDGRHRPIVVNRSFGGREGWPCPAVRQLVLVALTEGENHFGWLAAVNHAQDAEFGTSEASLLSSVAAILGIHGGNIELYRQQSELLAGIVRALTSAIDAKDQYTCGHSDRVARIAVRLAEELGCDAETLNTIYLAGLLHDIGKIGIDDQVLRKPDKLTDEEYEHIKRHVVIGHKILRDLGKLKDVLPVVLHHHESWDGAGYPARLGAQDIPLAARIVAVADSYDAMGSDRPYRKGMPEEKIERIFRSGAGQQWDPAVIEAFFRARADIHGIVATPAEQVEVQVERWQ